MMLRKILVIRVVVVSFFIQSCGSLGAPPIETARAGVIPPASPEAAGPAAFLAGFTPVASYDPMTGMEEPGEPVAQAEAGPPPQIVVDSGIEPAGEEGVLLFVEESGVTDGGNDGDLVSFSAVMPVTPQQLLEEPSGVDEKTVKAESALDAQVKKLIEKAGIKKPAKVTIVHPPGETEQLVLFYSHHSHEVLVLDALVGTDEAAPYGPAVDAVTHLLREPKGDEEIPIDPRLVVMLYVMASEFDSVLLVTSGYRKPGHGTKPSSYHTKGMAADVRHPWVSAVDLRDFAVAWGAGGVGLYPGDNAIHVDTRTQPFYWVGQPQKKELTPDMDGFWASLYREGPVDD